MEGAGTLPSVIKAGEMGLAEPAEVAPGGPNGSSPAHMRRSSGRSQCGYARIFSVAHGGQTGNNRHELKIRKVPTGYKEKYCFHVPSSVVGCLQRACAL